MPPDAPIITLLDDTQITTFTLGPFATNCFVVSRGGICWIADASFEPDPLIDHIKSRGLKPQALVLTHAHADHIAGIEQVMHALGDMPLLIHEDEQPWLSDPNANLSALHGVPITTRPPTATLTHNQSLELADLPWRVIHTPGHSPGGVALYHQPESGPPILIAGDALFAGSIGRTDFPSSNHDQLFNSIRDNLYTLPPNTIVLPGHGPPTTIQQERQTNPFVRP